MQIDNYRDRKAKGMIRLVAVSDKKAIASSKAFDQFTGEERDTQEVFLNIEDLHKQRTAMANQLTELDALIADVEDAFSKPNMRSTK